MNQSIEIKAIIKKETANAYLVSVRQRKIWLPKAYVKLHNTCNLDKTVRFTMPAWIANNRGFI